MKDKPARQPGMPTQGKTPAASALPLAIMIFSFILLSSSALAYDFTGRVENVSGPNNMWVNITQSGTYGLQAVVEVLLSKPLASLAYFKGKELQFEVKGHDILGRPVCEAYMEGKNIREVYNILRYPEKSCCGNATADDCFYEYDYAPPALPLGRCGCFYHDYPWLSFI